MNKEVKGIVFPWDPHAFDALVENSRFDDGLNISLRYMRRDMKILEAGCGGGRVVKYLYDLGYHDVHGLELGADAVSIANERFPELQIIQGDILAMPYPENTFDVVVSYGVVEHFTEGLAKPMAALRRVLKPGGIAIVTVPSLNRLRRAIDLLNIEIFGHNGRRSLLKEHKMPRANRRGNGYRYYVYPKYGEFFEYRLTPDEFEVACRLANFEIVESLPTCHDDGLFHTFGSNLVTLKESRFHVNPLGRVVNAVLKMIPFTHNHMHACVLRKLD